MSSTRRVGAVGADGVGSPSGAPATPESVLADLAQALGQVRRGRFDVRLTHRGGVVMAGEHWIRDADGATDRGWDEVVPSASAPTG